MIKEVTMEYSENIVKLIKEILNRLAYEFPTSQISQKWKDKIVLFLNSETEISNVEYFDFICEIGNLKIIQVTDKMYAGEISSFVKTVCEFNKYYKKPLNKVK